MDFDPYPDETTGPVVAILVALVVSVGLALALLIIHIFS